MSLDGGGGQRKWTRKKKILLLETPFDLIACAQQSASAALNFYELPSSPLKPQAPSTSLSSGSFLRPQLPYLLSSFTSSGASLQRWLSGKTICLPVLETQETLVRSLGGEDPLEKETATHSSILAWKLPRTEEPGRLQSTGSRRVRHD